MSFKLFIIPAAIISIIYGFAMASVASADHATVTVQLWQSECELVDGMVECDITSDYGISNVHVFMSSGIGDVTVFEQDYEDCPTEVQVSLDPIVLEENSEIDVETCGGPVVDCDGCIVCIAGECPGDLPGVGVSRPDPLPLKLHTIPTGPVSPTNSFVARN